MKQQYSKPKFQQVKLTLLEKIYFYCHHENLVLEHENFKIWWNDGKLIMKEGNAKEGHWTSPEALRDYIESGII